MILRNRWWEEIRSVYLERYGKYIDFVGREKNHGKIVLAIEVDRGHRAQRSWDKLVNINADNKIWIYVTDPERASAHFDEAKKAIRRFLRFRGVEATKFGKFKAAKTLKPACTRPRDVPPAPLNRSIAVRSLIII